MITGVLLTYKCNLKCVMCPVWSMDDNQELKLDDIKELVDAVSPGCCYFSFSGGEPLLVKDIYKMLSYASAKIPFVHLVSNGLILTEEVASRLASTGLAEVSLSLDGEESFHNLIRGNEQSFKKVIEAISNIKKHAPKVKISINAVIFPGYLNQLKKTVELAKELNINIKVMPVIRHFYFSKEEGLLPEMKFDNIDTQELSELIKYLRNCKHVLNSKFYLKSIINYFLRYLSTR